MSFTLIFLAMMASSELDRGTCCSVLSILNHRPSKVVLYLLLVVLMMRLGERKSVVPMLQLVVLNERKAVLIRANTQLLAFFHIGAFAGVIQFISDSTITDRTRKTFLMFHNMGIPFFVMLFAKLTLSLGYLALFFLVSLPITHSVLTLSVITMSVLLALTFGILTFSIVMLLFDPSSLILTTYLPVFVSFGLFMVYYNTPSILGKGIFVVLIAAIGSLCLHLVLKSKRLRFNL